MEYFRVKDFEAPLVRMINMTDQVTFQLPSDYPDEETVKQFCQSYLDGKAKVTLSTVFTWLWNVIDDNAHNNMNVLWVWVEQMAPLHVVFPLSSFFILFLTIELFIKKKKEKKEKLNTDLHCPLVVAVKKSDFNIFVSLLEFHNKRSRFHLIIWVVFGNNINYNINTYICLCTLA